MITARVIATGPASPEPGTAKARVSLTLLVPAELAAGLAKGSLVELQLPSPSDPAPVVPTARKLVSAPGQSGGDPADTEPRAAAVKREAAAKARRETEEQKNERRAQQHPSWTEDARKGFAAELASLQLGIAGDIYVVSAWCEAISAKREARGQPAVLRPSHRDPAARQRLLGVLREGSLREDFLAWALYPVPRRVELPEPQAALCKSCGAEILWVPLNGKMHPCDPELKHAMKGGRGALVTLVGDDGRVHQRLGLDPEGTTSGRISHFATCPHAEEHRKRGKA